MRKLLLLISLLIAGCSSISAENGNRINPETISDIHSIWHQSNAEDLSDNDSVSESSEDDFFISYVEINSTDKYHYFLMPDIAAISNLPGSSFEPPSI